jgi:hypothetical protein
VAGLFTLELVPNGKRFAQGGFQHEVMICHEELVTLEEYDKKRVCTKYWDQENWMAKTSVVLIYTIRHIINLIHI